MWHRPYKNDKTTELLSGMMSGVGSKNLELDGRAQWCYLANTAERLYGVHGGYAWCGGDATYSQITLSNLILLISHCNESEISLKLHGNINVNDFAVDEIGHRPSLDTTHNAHC